MIRRSVIPVALTISLAAPCAFGQSPAPAPAPAETIPAEAPAGPDSPPVEAAPQSPPPAEAAPPAVDASASPPPVAPAPPPAAAPPLQSYPLPSPVEREEPEPDDGTLGNHQEHWALGVDVRTSFIDSSGYYPFSENDVLGSFGVFAGRVTTVEGPFSVVALLGYAYGGAEDDARGSETELHTHRMWIAGEGRYHVFRRLYGFVRLAPAVFHTIATLRDPVASANREVTSWTFGADASLGAAFEVIGKASGSSKEPRAWLSLDGGYGWASSSDLSFLPDEDESAPTRTAALELGELAIRGPFARAGLVVTF